MSFCFGYIYQFIVGVHGFGKHIQNVPSLILFAPQQLADKEENSAGFPRPTWHELLSIRADKTQHALQAQVFQRLPWAQRPGFDRLEWPSFCSSLVLQARLKQVRLRFSPSLVVFVDYFTSFMGKEGPRKASYHPSNKVAAGAH